MHYPTHALLNCVACFGLLSYGNAARAAAPAEALAHLTRALDSRLAEEHHQAVRANGSAAQKEEEEEEEEGAAPSRRQIDRPRVPLTGNFPIRGLPFEFERSYQYRYPPFSQQLSQSLLPGGEFVSERRQLVSGPRLFQQQLSPRELESLQQEAAKSRTVEADANVETRNDVVKGSRNVKGGGGSGGSSVGGGGGDSILNLDSSIDSKSSAQSRPYDTSEFFNQAGALGAAGQDAGIGNLRVDNRFSAIDYERIRQNYYSDPPINQQRNFYNGVPLNVPGLDYRSTGIDGRYGGLNYNEPGDNARPGIGTSQLRSAGGIEDVNSPYFSGYIQNPYRTFGYNSQPGGRGNFPFSGSFDSSFNGPQFSGGDFGGSYYSGAGNGAPSNLGFGEFDSSLRATASKETRAKPLKPSRVSQRDDEKKSPPVTRSGEEEQKNQA